MARTGMGTPRIGEGVAVLLEGYKGPVGTSKKKGPGSKGDWKNPDEWWYAYNDSYVKGYQGLEKRAATLMGEGVDLDDYSDPRVSQLREDQRNFQIDVSTGNQLQKEYSKGWAEVMKHGEGEFDEEEMERWKSFYLDNKPSLHREDAYKSEHAIMDDPYEGAYQDEDGEWIYPKGKPEGEYQQPSKDDYRMGAPPPFPSKKPEKSAVYKALNDAVVAVPYTKVDEKGMVTTTDVTASHEQHKTATAEWYMSLPAHKLEEFNEELGPIYNKKNPGDDWNDLTEQDQVEWVSEWGANIKDQQVKEEEKRLLDEPKSPPSGSGKDVTDDDIMFRDKGIFLVQNYFKLRGSEDKIAAEVMLGSAVGGKVGKGTVTEAEFGYNTETGGAVIKLKVQDSATVDAPLKDIELDLSDPGTYTVLNGIFSTSSAGKKITDEALLQLNQKNSVNHFKNTQMHDDEWLQKQIVGKAVDEEVAVRKISYVADKFAADDLTEAEEKEIKKAVASKPYNDREIKDIHFGFWGSGKGKYITVEFEKGPNLVLSDPDEEERLKFIKYYNLQDIIGMTEEEEEEIRDAEMEKKLGKPKEERKGELFNKYLSK